MARRLRLSGGVSRALPSRIACLAPRAPSPCCAPALHVPRAKHRSNSPTLPATCCSNCALPRKRGRPSRRAAAAPCPAKLPTPPVPRAHAWTHGRIPPRRAPARRAPSPLAALGLLGTPSCERWMLSVPRCVRGDCVVQPSDDEEDRSTWAKGGLSMAWQRCRCATAAPPRSRRRRRPPTQLRLAPLLALLRTLMQRCCKAFRSRQRSASWASSSSPVADGELAAACASGRSDAHGATRRCANARIGATACPRAPSGAAMVFPSSEAAVARRKWAITAAACDRINCLPQQHFLGVRRCGAAACAVAAAAVHQGWWCVG